VETDGTYCRRVPWTDIHTTWVDTRAVLGKSQERVRQALDTITEALPFALRGIDSDNGSEFINDHLYRYFRARHSVHARTSLQEIRQRAYRTEELDHVRKIVGYDRFDSAAALAALNTLYADLRLLQNLWLPSVKLRLRERSGCRNNPRP
jgi:hypothetical protein